MFTSLNYSPTNEVAAIAKDTAIVGVLTERWLPYMSSCMWLLTRMLQQFRHKKDQSIGLMLTLLLWCMV